MHKQSALMKELTVAYGDLLQDPRIRAEQARYDALSRTRNTTLSKFKKTYQAFLDIWAGLEKARAFYSEMIETAESLEKNVETFVANRRSEGSMLLSSIEKEKGTDADRQQRKLQEMMTRMSVGNSPQDPKSPSAMAPIPVHTITTSPPPTPGFPPQQRYASGYGANQTPPPVQGMIPPPPPPPPSAGPYQTTFGQYPNINNGYGRRESYSQGRPDSFQVAVGPNYRDSQMALPSPGLPPSSQQYHPGHYSSSSAMYPGQQGHSGQQGFTQPQPYNPGAYIPPPPPGQPGLGNRQSYGVLPQTTYQPPPPPPPPPAGQQQQQYAGQQGQQVQGGNGQDPWAGLAGWR